jgi:prepilin-type N-terminal cleavage/methylation domain-containing protein
MSKNQSGFTLLEVIVSLVILALALSWILMGQAESIKRNIRARYLSQAVYLTKYKMDQTEFTLKKEGFSDFEDENCDTFEKDDLEGVENFKYCVIIEKIEIPDITMLQEKLMGGLGMGNTGGTEGNSEEENPMMGMLSQFMPGLSPDGEDEISKKFNDMAAQFLGPALGMIQGVLEESIRKVTVRVSWYAVKKERHFELVSYFTDSSLIGGGGSMFSPPVNPPPKVN